ncbi:MAG TPA: acyl-CoA dehydrogenase, partial [Alphaproteobacteria bacterium]|nr:acyl-CoA dehydrogenase [Alphaproteobacteria bacterium]
MANSALLSEAHHAAHAAERLVAQVRGQVAAKVSAKGIDQEQHAAHGFAWAATYATALREMARWAERLSEHGKFGALEQLILKAVFSEYLAQLVGGLPVSQTEMVRLGQIGASHDDIDKFMGPSARLIHQGFGDADREALAQLIASQPGASTFGDCGLDEDMDLIREQFAKFAAAKVTPFAHHWHLKDELIPLSIIEEMSGLGVFGLTIPEEFGGAGMGKTAMCVVSEELSRGYIGVGSLGTRSEIAAELILAGGTAQQKAHWLPKIASGAILPTAVFTEPNTGSDLGSLRTRAVRDGDVWRVTGNKTWITHAARADVMTLLVRTNPDAPGYRGLSMFLAEKPRGTDANPFPAAGMTGGEIEVLGYRGMKEYEIGFDGFEVPHANLLGAEEGQGFKQLMQTFESARIQTAARAVGVAQNAMDLALRYALDRVQFGKPIGSFQALQHRA